MSLEVNGLTPQQESAIVALLNEGTVGRASETCGVPERTLYRWLSERPFKREYARCRRVSFAHAVAIAQKFAPIALANLVKISNDQSAPCSARVAASIAVARFARESIELDEVIDRIELLEDRVVAEQDGSES